MDIYIVDQPWTSIDFREYEHSCKGYIPTYRGNIMIHPTQQETEKGWCLKK